MKTAIEAYGVVLLVVVVLAVAGSTTATLHCQHCLFEACDSPAEEKIECNVPTVNRLYRHLAALANLEGLLPAPDSTTAQSFQCFQVVVFDGSKNGTVRSCAFAESDICSAWKPGITVESCETCRDEEHCSDGFGDDSPATFAQHSNASAGLPVHWIVVASAALIALQIGSIKL